MNDDPNSGPAQKNAGAPVCSEKELADQTGLSRPDLAQIRAKLLEGEHWTKAGNLIVWLPAGIEALRAELAKKEGGAPDGADPVQEALLATASTPARSEPEVLEVARLVSNTRVVIAVMEGELHAKKREEITVRGVRDSRLLTKGQKIRATRDPHGPVWNWFGPYPSRKGQTLVAKPQPQKTASAGARTQKEGGAL